MQVFKSSIILSIFLSIWCKLSAQDGITLLGREVSCQADTSTVEQILERVIDENGLYFSYNPDILPKQKITVQLSNVTLGELLHKILPTEEFKIEVINNQIIITTNDIDPIKLSGRVVEGKDGDPIPYASLTIDGEGMGSMTNLDGRFDLIVPTRLCDKKISARCLGFEPRELGINDLMDNPVIRLEPATVHLREIKVKPVNVADVLKSFRENIGTNYELSAQLMVTFYRETIKRDNQYIGVWEAVMEMLKSPYTSGGSDKVRFIKGRKSNFNKDFTDVRLKIQGGPWYIATLDIVKNLETFLDPQFEHLYKYRFDLPIMYNGRLTWVIRFSRKENVDFPCYSGKILIDADTYALVKAEFGLDKKSLKMNGETFIMKEPFGFTARPDVAEYLVDYRLVDGRWQFCSARTDVTFKVKQNRGNIRTAYQSVSDILVTQQYTFPRKARFGSEGLFRANDIFSDIIGSYDPEFWDGYNVIKPDEELSKAIREIGTMDNKGNNGGLNGGN